MTGIGDYLNLNRTDWDAEVSRAHAQADAWAEQYAAEEGYASAAELRAAINEATRLRYLAELDAGDFDDCPSELLHCVRKKLQAPTPGPVLFDSALNADQRDSRFLRILRRCARVVDRLNVRHVLAPSRSGEGSVGRSPASTTSDAGDAAGQDAS